MKSPRCHSLNTQGSQALPHLGGGFGGEGEGKNLLWLILSLRNSVGNPVGQGSGLTRSRSRQNAERTAPGGGDHPLGFI